MKDSEWCKKIEDRLESIETFNLNLRKRLDKLEGNTTCSSYAEEINICIDLPEDNIDGLYFNAQRVHAVFVLKEDGNYYSRDILFNSARDLDKETGRDLLSEYLKSDAVKMAFIKALENIGMKFNHIDIFLPEENQGIKKYNGVDWWYWLRKRSSGSSSHFAGVNISGFSTSYNASAVGGVAPGFCVDNQHG